MTKRFPDRRVAGRLLAERLREYAGDPGALVLALPRGGVPVGYEIARALGLPLDVFLVRKLGVPGHEELAMGAIAMGGVRVVNPDVIANLAIPQHVLDTVTAAEQQELERRQRLYRDDRPAPELGARTVILVDDGLATGATMHAAVAAVRAQDPARVIIAVPTAAPQTCATFAPVVDAIVCGITPDPFYAVGLWYDDFTPTGDDEVREMLGAAGVRPVATPAAPAGGSG